MHFTENQDESSTEEKSEINNENKEKPKTSNVNLTDAELKEFKEIFDLVDKDGGGTISKDELGQLMETLGLQPTEEQIDSMMEEVDENHTGEISFEQFVSVMGRKVQANYTQEQLKAAFKLFETEDVGSGFVRTDVLEKALTTYGEDKLTVEEAAELLQAVDPENTGKINYIEYIKMMQQK